MRLMFGIVAIGLGTISPVRAAPRILLEAEDFQATGAWEARPWSRGYFCASFANTFHSHQAHLAAPTQCAKSEAQITFEVPEDGRYAVFARYECPYMHNVAFEVRLEQNRKVVLQRAYGGLDNPKIWPFGKGLQPMVSYSWGGGDNIVWEGSSEEVALEKGEAYISLIAGPQPEPAAERHVDVLLVTPLDEEVKQRIAKEQYLPLDGLLTQDGELFLRVTNPGDGRGPLLVNLKPVEHSPYWVHQRNWPRRIDIGANGLIESKVADADYLQPGQSSPWVEIGRFMDRLNETTLKIAPVYPKTANPPEGLDLQFEFAVPEAQGKLRTVKQIRCADPQAHIARFAIPGNIRSGEPIRTDEEVLQELLAQVKAFPEFGRTPELIGIHGVFSTHFMAEECSPRVLDLAKQLERTLIGEAQDKGAIKFESLGDEIHLSKVAKTPAADAAFRQYLREKGLQPKDLLPAQVLQAAPGATPDALWQLVELEYQNAATNPRLWYHSQVFGYEQGGRAFDPAEKAAPYGMLSLKAATEKIEAAAQTPVFVGANYSPHPQYWPKEFQWVRPFKLRAMTLPWSEDYVWGVPELSPQVTGYLLDVFRCAAKYHDLPIMYYVMPHSPGNTPRSFRLSYYAALGHGAKVIHHFCVTPVVTAYTENYVDAKYVDMYREIHDIARELGQFEDILFSGKVWPAQVAMLISGTTDLWNPSANYNHERKCLYYALRHAGIPVDFVTEDDIVEGRLKPYRVLYISATHMPTAAAEQLSRWAEDGGVVFSSAGGGLLNEYNEPNQPMMKLFGLTDQKLYEEPVALDTKFMLPRQKPLDMVRLTLAGRDAALPAIVAKQTVTLSGAARAVGVFGNDQPAVALNSHGKGQAMLVGTFPGAAYVQPAIPLRPWDRGTTDDAMCHFLPTQFDPTARELILWPVRQAGLQPEVALSEPIVEWSAVDSPRGTAILLTNWTGRPIANLIVQVRADLGGRSVSSVRRGRLEPTRGNDGWQVNLPLDITDCITIRP